LLIELELFLALAGWLLLIGFLIWLLRYCLRIGAIGRGAVPGDATRSERPIQFWSGIVGLAFAIGIMIFGFFEAIWKTALR
jgi:hypothetical protein